MIGNWTLHQLLMSCGGGITGYFGDRAIAVLLVSGLVLVHVPVSADTAAGARLAAERWVIQVALATVFCVFSWEIHALRKDVTVVACRLLI
jgi:hypothetical protein